MKKILVTLSALCIWICALADVVPSSTALSVAKKFMNKTDLTLAWNGEEAATRSDEAPAFYVFNVEGGGWVIVSGDDCTTPILGYSETGTFRTDAMPVNISGWLGVMRTDIRKARQEGQKGDENVRKRWEDPRRHQTRADATTKVLSTPNWNQLSPYNNYLSTYVTKNGRGVSNLCTGCVATAMAEVLYYHKWPATGTGTLDSYTTSSSSYSVKSLDISNHTYDWDNMLSSYGNSATTTQKNAVALLMLDCGVMVQMNYGTSSDGGSGAYSSKIVPALISHMQYSKNAQEKYRENYSLNEWMEMIEYEIDNNGPVLYGGSGDDGGHQFVCDGYDTDNNMIHINWGWSGSNNGYFTLTLSIPKSYTFDEGQSAIFGLVPDKDGTSEYADPELEMVAYSYNDTVDGIVLDSGSIGKGETFLISFGKINNPSSLDYTGAFKAVMMDKDGNWKQDVSEEIDLSGDDALPAGYICWFENGDEDERLECKITRDIKLGDRIAIWYKLSDGSWTPVKHSHEDYGYLWELACVDACFIKTESSYSAGDYFYYELVPGNTTIDSVTWKFDGSTVSDTPAGTRLTSGTHNVVAAITYSDNSTETITQVLIVK